MILTGKTQKQVDKEKADNDEAQRVAGIKAELNKLDRKAIRALLTVANNNSTQNDIDFLAELGSQAIVLRQSLVEGE